MRKLIVALLLSGVTAAHAQTLEELGLRAITKAEDRALLRLLKDVEKLLPAPDAAKWERVDSDGTADKEKRLGTLLGGDQVFGECEPSKGGCFPDDVSVQLNYAPKGATEAAKARAVKAESKPKDPDDPLGTLMALAEEAEEAGKELDRQLTVYANVLGEPAHGECLGDPKPTEARPDFKFDLSEEEYEGDRITARFVFGTRMCDIPLWPRATAKTPLAPVHAIEVSIDGPPTDVRKLAQRVDRKAFNARLGPVPLR